MTDTQEAECLKCNPFEGDFGSPCDRELKDKIVTARKAGTCGMCRQGIAPGERVRTLAGVFDGSLMHYRWCEKCCVAMAASKADNGDAWTARTALARMGPNAPDQAPGSAPTED